MTPQIHLGKHQINDLQAISDLGANRVSLVVDHLAQLKRTLLKPSELLAAVKDSLSGAESASDSLVRQAIFLNGLIRRSGLELDAVMAGVRLTIERDTDWAEAWNAIEAKFKELLSSKACRLVAKAIDLSYEYANLYRKARILTDIRPLFTEDADAIEAAVVSYTLRLRFDSTDGDHELSIAMDESDVREIATQCERALKKASTARDLMQRTATVPTFVAGEQGDA